MNNHVLKLTTAIALLICSAAAQNAPASAPSPQTAPVAAPGTSVADDVPHTAFTVVSKTKVPFVSGSFALGSTCNADGTIFGRAATVLWTGPNQARVVPGNETQKLYGISPDAKTVTIYATDKIIDVPGAQMIRYATSEAAVYLLISALENPERKTRRYRLQSGETFEQQQVEGTSRFYIARFDYDGTYRGSAKLDVDFFPMQLAAFSTGDFLIAGRTLEDDVPRIAVVKSNGQLDRYVTLRGDMKDPKFGYGRAETEEGYWNQQYDRVHTLSQTQLVAFRGDILLVRRGQSTLIFEISPSGQVRRFGIKSPEGFTFAGLRVDGNHLVTEFQRRVNAMVGIESVFYVVDPEDGRWLEKYEGTRPGGLGLACVHDGALLFLRSEGNETFVIKLEPAKTAPVMPTAQ